MPELHTIWFVLVAILFAGYAVLDGFDLGVGVLGVFARDDKDHGLLLHSIAPLWHGNEVWLITGGGALFAAFPDVYAAVFSGFYAAFFLLLFALIARAVSIECRGKSDDPRWRKAWDRVFSMASGMVALLLGIVFGNLVRGIPISAHGEYAGTFFGLLNPYALLMGVTSLALFSMHGAAYLALKTEGSLQEQTRAWLRRSFSVFLACYAATAAVTLLYIPHAAQWLGARRLGIALALLNILAMANIWREARRGKDAMAFYSSCALILLSMAMFGLGMYPVLVYSTPMPEHSLTIYNAASSAKALSAMLKIAAIGMPLVLVYVFILYRAFRGKVRSNSESY